MNLHEEITARIDAKEAFAESLASEHPSPWRTEWDGQDYLLLDAEGDEITSATYAIATWEPDASLDRASCNTKRVDWLRDHDPATVLRGLAEDRDILARHYQGSDEGGFPTCVECDCADFECWYLLGLARRHGIEVEL